MSRVEEAQAWFLFFRDYTIALPQPRQRTYLPLLDPEICRVRHGWQREGLDLASLYTSLGWPHVSLENEAPHLGGKTDPLA